MFFDFLDMFIHQWETKEDYDCVMQMQEQEDWEAFRAANQPKEPKPLTGIFASASFANLQKVSSGKEGGGNTILDL